MPRPPKLPGAGWRVATILLAGSTVLLAILLVGSPGLSYLAERRDQNAIDATTTTTAPDQQARTFLLYALNDVLRLRYSPDQGWPSAVTVDEFGTARTNDGTILGTVPAGCTLSYETTAEGGYSLQLRDASGNTIGVSSPNSQSANDLPPGFAEKTVGTMAYLIKQQYSAPWPDSLTVSGTGELTGPDGTVLGFVPETTTFSYTTSADASNFEIAMVFADGSGARYSYATNLVETLY